jgi:arabinogalactan oligomer / maltooligosaccharide transport system permease protein
LSALSAAVDRVRLRTRDKRAPQPRASFGDTWWRHVVGVVAVGFALFPVWFVVSAAFSRDDSVSGTSFLPAHLSTENFTQILTNKVPDQGTQSYVDSHFLHWLLNTIGIALAAALGTIILGSLAAYAFSRFRFRGRRLGMLGLLLIQMFPQLLLVVSIYLIVLNVGDIFPVLSLNTYSGLIIVYLGGALGVNAWLLKGFFDTIPSELDESARVDGATPAQIFWGVVMPLAAPVLVVVGLISFISTLNEFVIASALMQTQDHLTLAVGMNGFIDQKYGQRWGPFAAGTVLAAIPAAALFMSLQKWLIGGLTQGAVKG